MIFRNLKILFLLFIAVCMIAATTGVLKGFKASVSDQSQNIIIVEWSLNSEDAADQIDHFELDRKFNEDASFVKISDVPVRQGESSNLQYQYFDKSLFKASSNTELVVYQLKIYFKDGHWQTAQTNPVSYTTTAIRSTWGSIKAMFQ